MSLKAGFGGNCILGQEAANLTSENEEEGRRGKKKKGAIPSFRMQNRLFYGSKSAGFNIGLPSLIPYFHSIVSIAPYL